MKLSISLAQEDVDFMDAYAGRAGLPSRSSVVQKALSVLRTADMEDSYARASQEWYASGEAEIWDSVIGDGLD